MKSIAIFATTVALFLTACASNEKVPVEDNHALYLRGEMNDYAISESYRLRSYQDSLCTQATLRADWAPYKFKFADANWSDGYNYGYLNPPGVLRLHSAPQKLNPNSRFEELRFYPQKDGVYRFCLIKRNDGFYAEVTLEPSGSMRSLFSEIKSSIIK